MMYNVCMWLEMLSKQESSQKKRVLQLTLLSNKTLDFFKSLTFLACLCFILVCLVPRFMIYCVMLMQSLAVLHTIMSLNGELQA